LLNKLSDFEIIQLGSFIASGNIEGVVKYINQLLHKRSLGIDGCSRPLSMRDPKHLEHSCFAKGYIEKIREFVSESGKRLNKDELLKNVDSYCSNLVIEINSFFLQERKPL